IAIPQIGLFGYTASAEACQCPRTATRAPLLHASSGISSCHRPAAETVPTESPSGAAPRFGRSARPKRRIRSRMQYLAFKEKVREIRTRVCEFRVTVEFVRNAGECVQFRRDICRAKDLQQVFAAFGAHRHIGQAVEDDRRRKSSLNVRDGTCLMDGFISYVRQ